MIATRSRALGADRDDLVGEHVGPDLALGVLLAGLGVERARAVELVGLVPLGRVVAEALAGHHVHDHRAVELLRLGERLLDRRTVVAVDGADVLQAEVLEEALRGEGVLHALLHRVQRVVDGRADAADAVEPLLDQVEDLLVAGAGAQRRQVVGEAADGRGVGPAVVVDHDDQPAVAGAPSAAMLFSASQAIPPVSAPSPITAATCRSSPRTANALARPSA